MSAIIKTWPSFFTAKHMLLVFTHKWAKYYFSIGRGRPSQKIEEIWFTHHGRIVGHFKVDEVVQNAGQLPPLESLDGNKSPWQIKPDYWVAICSAPFHILKEKLYYESFRGFRYFDLEKHRGTRAARVKI